LPILYIVLPFKGGAEVDFPGGEGVTIVEFSDK
jgi:hypothetical protein